MGAGLGGDGRRKTAGEEFTRFGEEADYRVLAEMCDESLELLRLFWSGEEVNYHGKHYNVEKATFLPKPLQKPSIPIWIGGNSKAALRRVSKYDGWITGGPCPSVGDPGFSPSEVKKKAVSIGKRVEVAYAYEYSEDEAERRVFLQEVSEVGIDWSLDLVSAMRFDGKTALDYIKKGPPDTQISS